MTRTVRDLAKLGSSVSGLRMSALAAAFVESGYRGPRMQA
jgi:hypothetical protein